MRTQGVRRGLRWLFAVGDGPEAHALNRLGLVHAASAAGDALVAVALAGTLFFAVPLDAARSHVALYLVCTLAPFAVVAPLLGRLLDGHPAASRLAVVIALVARTVLAGLMASRTTSLALYPLAFGLLVGSRVHGISRSALVPRFAAVEGRLVVVNGRFARLGAAAGSLGALLGAGLAKLFQAGAVMQAAALVFAVGAVLSAVLPGVREEDPVRALGAASRTARPPVIVRLARAANSVVRAAGGFTLFLLAFGLRARGVGAAGLGMVLAAVGVGNLVGALAAPRAARWLREEGLLALALTLAAATGALLAGRVTPAWSAAAGLAMGTAVAAARLAFESLVQRRVPGPAQGTTFTRSETAFQLAWVVGAVIPVGVSLPPDPSLRAMAVVCVVALAGLAVGLSRDLALRRAAKREQQRIFPASAP